MKRIIAVEMTNGDTREWVVECNNFDSGYMKESNFFIVVMDDRRILINRDKVLSIDVSPVTMDTAEGADQ